MACDPQEIEIAKLAAMNKIVDILGWLKLAALALVSIATSLIIMSVIK